MIKILQEENPKLRAKAGAVSPEDIGGGKIKKVITDMQNAMHAQEDSVAIAAPQIGVPFRIFVVSGKMFLPPEEEHDTKRVRLHDAIFINPEITKRSRKLQELEEGCLSIRWKYGFVKRSDKVTVRALDESGKQFTRGASGLLAQIFQHETDHLNGILFTDKAKNVRDLPPNKKVQPFA